MSVAQAASSALAGCQPLISAAQPADPLTARWYRRFWTGDCGRLSGCVSGSPNWNEVIGKLIARSPGPDRGAVLKRACRLGPLIGLEWTRPRSVRRIDTGDLRKFKAKLESSTDVMIGLQNVEDQARAAIAQTR